jgi:hypothetical protein
MRRRMWLRFEKRQFPLPLRGRRGRERFRAMSGDAQKPLRGGETVQAAYFVLCHMPSILISSLFMHTVFFLVQCSYAQYNANRCLLSPQ